MGKVIVVASGKGGTGKTTFSTCISAALAYAGKKVLAVDADAGMRNVDIALGMSDRVIFSFADVLGGACELSEAAAAHPDVSGLFVLTAPSDNYAFFYLNTLVKLFPAFREEFDYTVIDCPAGLDPSIASLAAAADRAVIVATPDPASLRGALTISGAFRAAGQNDCRLAVNRARKELISRGQAVNIDDAMDDTGLPLLGVIPEDMQMIVKFNAGELGDLSRACSAQIAFINIAERILGKRVRLFRGIPKKFWK